MAFCEAQSGRVITSLQGPALVSEHAAAAQRQEHPEARSVLTHTGHREADHVLNSHPIHRCPDHLLGNLGHVLRAAELHIVHLNKGHEIGQGIPNRLSDFSSVGLNSPLNLTRTLCSAILPRLV